MKHSGIIALLIVLSQLFCVNLSNAQKSIVVDGKTRQYIEYVPQNLGSKRPLLISAHGMNQDANYQKNMLSVESVADANKFVTVFPQGEGNAWDISGQKDINFIKALINKMVTDYDIDPNKVYMSGFSMGGMLTYHCMNNLYDKIAAFAPISGYPMGGFNCTAKRPIPVIHTHGTTDDVVAFSGVQGNLNKLIAYDKCNTTATVTKNYKGYGHITKHEWSGGTNGTKVVLMELANKGHWVSNDGLKTVQEIWDFCKNYSLEERPVQVNVTSIHEGDIVPETFTIKGTATSTKGNIKEIKLFEKVGDGSYKNIETLSGKADFEFEIKDRADGKYGYAIRADDDQGNNNNVKINVTVQNGYVDPGKCICYTSVGGSNAWDNQGSYDLPQPLTKGNNYTLTLKAKATSACDCAFWPTWEASPNRNQWNGTNDVQYLDNKRITTEWKTYTWKFTASFPLDRLSFVFGTLNGKIYFDDITLVDDAIGVNYVQNGDFENGSSEGWSSASSYMGTSFAVVSADGQQGDTGSKEPEIPDTWPLAQQGDPNFHIYLCFGQSNMEGNAAVEAIDRQNVPERFKMMAAVNFSSPARTKGNWYKAIPPLCRQGTGLTPADYFGRTLCDSLPENISIGVINIAVGGAKIELFMDEYKDDYIAGEAGWFQNYCAQYDNDPLGRLIEMGKKAQEKGVIKGILMHQGESNNGQADWAEKVAKVYKRICYYLGLDPAQTPLLAGETLYANQGGACSWHNTAALPKLKNVIPNSYVISAEGLPGNGVDAFHFNAAGYREFGKRYAEQMLKLLPKSEPELVGDVNGDGTVDISDINAVISVICGTAQNGKADVNNDKVVDISDINAIISMICGQ